MRSPRHESPNNGNSRLNRRSASIPTHFELWDIETNNLVGTYDTEADALAIVRNSIRTYGLPSIEHLALGYEDRRGRTTCVAHGQQLADLAESVSAMEGELAHIAAPTT